VKFRNLNLDRSWLNDRKQQGSQPDFEGTLNVKGEEFSISAWKRGDGNGSDAQTCLSRIGRKAETLSSNPGTRSSIPNR